VSRISGYDCTAQTLPIGSLMPHPTVQRVFRADKAEKIKSRFDANALRPLLVVPAPKNGSYLVWDGQHRLWALRELFPATKTVQCQIYTGLTEDKLAELQELFNDGTTQWTQLERFANLMLAKEPSVMAISAMVQSFGLFVGSATTHDGIKAVSALRSIYGKTEGPTLLSETLGILHGAWGADWDAYQTPMLTGTAAFVEKHRGLALASLSMRLRKDGTAASFLGAARSRSKVSRCSVAVAVASNMVASYNIRRKTDRLPAFHT